MATRLEKPGTDPPLGPLEGRQPCDSLSKAQEPVPAPSTLLPWVCSSPRSPCQPPPQLQWLGASFPSVDWCERVLLTEVVGPLEIVILYQNRFDDRQLLVKHQDSELSEYLP